MFKQFKTQRTRLLLLLLFVCSLSSFMSPAVLMAQTPPKVIGYLADGKKIYQETTDTDIVIPSLATLASLFLPAAEPDETPLFARLFGMGSSIGSIIWQNVYATPMITIEGVGYVYCIQPLEDAPNGQHYDAGTVEKDAGVTKILQEGFPYHKGNFTEHEAYIRTFVALNAYLGSFNRGVIETYGDAYVNHLLKEADIAAKAPLGAQEVKLIEPADKTAVYNEKTARLETAPYQIQGPKGNFWLEHLPEDIYAVDAADTRVDTLAIGNEFRIVSENVEQAGDVRFNIKTDVQESVALRYQAAGVQDLMALRPQAPIAPITSRIVMHPRKDEVRVEQAQKERVPKILKETTPPAVQDKRVQKTLVATGRNDARVIAAFIIFLSSFLYLFVKVMRWNNTRGKKYQVVQAIRKKECYNR